MLDYLIPEQEVLAPDALVQQLAASPLQEPFTEAVLTFITELSRSILMDRALRDFPELIALAHWFRPSQLQAIKADFEQRRCSKIHRPRGLVFHIAPANVDSIFVYSWLLSFTLKTAMRQSESSASLPTPRPSLLHDRSHRKDHLRTQLKREFSVHR